VALDEGNCLEHIFDVAMAPVLPFDLGDRGDVCIVDLLVVCLVCVLRGGGWGELELTSGAKGVNLAGEDEQDEPQNEQGTQTQTHARGHCGDFCRRMCVCEEIAG
jgi:hypothetical protein